MKDIFAKRATDSFWNLMSEFGTALKESFPDCDETKDWVLWCENVIGDDPGKRSKGIETWYDTMNTPLTKGCAKYGKAVQSITKQPATVYHAVAYRDSDAAHATANALQSLDFPNKMKSLNPEERDVFWQYLTELNGHAYGALRKPLPSVPTSEDIAKDITRRKTQASTSKTLESTLTGPGNFDRSIDDLWKQLCTSRTVDSACPSDAIVTKLETFVIDRNETSLEIRSKQLLEHLSGELGTTPFTQEQWDQFESLHQLCTMQSAIPKDMMRGIESVANGLVEDMAKGRTNLETIDVEAIGQKVLSQVSADDISSFANNLDKILPALGQITKQ